MSRSPFDLSGKVALVTGSTRGIGKSIAEEMARARAKVVLSSREAEACEQVRAEFEQLGYEVLARPCNVSRKDDLQALVDAALERRGAIDIAGYSIAIYPSTGMGAACAALESAYAWLRDNGSQRRPVESQR